MLDSGVDLLKLRGGDVNVGRVVLPLNPWDQREESAAEIMQRRRAKLTNVPGVRVVVTQPGGLGQRGPGSPVRMVLGGSNYAELAKWRDLVLARAGETPGLGNLDSDYYERKPQLDVAIDHLSAFSDTGAIMNTMLNTTCTGTACCAGYPGACGSL